MPGPRDAFDDEVATSRVDRQPSQGGAPTLLVLLDGAIHTHALPAAGRAVLGRSPQCDVRVAHESVSRQHAAFELGAATRVRDLGSANGVWVRGQRLGAGEAATVTSGEVLRVGSVTVVFQHGATHAASPPLPPAPPPAPRDARADLVVADPAMVRLHELLAGIRDSAISVLLLGETGVGKEVVAEAIHRASSRAAGPLVRLHCAALSHALLESELFGHEKGAFTGAEQAKPGLLETADGGTVFLDEVGELPLATQVKLLRALEERSVQRVGALRPRAIDVRFVAATNRDLRAEVERGAFRQDLYFRLNGLSLIVPPLRERPAEIAQLARSFLAGAAASLRRPAPALAPEALALLQSYRWPGNVRELRNAMERAVLLARDGRVGPAELPPELRDAPAPAQAPAPALATPAREGAPAASEALRAELEATERRHILEALERCGGNQTRAAELLGVSRRTMVSRLKAYDVPRPRKR